jgi:hypothetical protein
MREKSIRPTAGDRSQSGFGGRFLALLQRRSSIFLWALILLGMACRFYGLNWDEGTQLHPDERFCISLVGRLTPPKSIAQFFDSSSSTLNPVNLKDTHYVYGQLPLFIGVTVGNLTHRNQGGDFTVVGRFLAALFDCGTILFTLLIARRLFGTRWALVAAALVAGAALHIQQSHFFVVDPFAAFFLTASFWAGTRLVQENKGLDALWCGLFFGAALACKISAVLFGSALLGILVLFAAKNPWRKTLLCALLCLTGAFLAFRLGHPMAFRGETGFFDLRPEPRFWSDVREQAGITNGTVDVPFDVQWIGRTPWLFSLRNLGFWGYGWPFLISAGLGFLLLLKKRQGHGLLFVGALFGLVLLGIQGAAFSKFTRYFLPLTPFCALLAVHFWREVSAKKTIGHWGTAAVALSVALWGLSVASIYGRQHSRLAASDWILKNIPAGTRVANETSWDEGLPISWRAPGTGGLEPLVLESYDLDSAAKREQLARNLDRVQWVFISSGRSWQNIPRWPEKWPMMTAYYRALFNGDLGFGLEKSFSSFPQLGPFQFPDANVEEALTVYDHPLVLLFHKTPEYDGEKVRAILDAVPLPDGQQWQPKLAPKPDESALPVPRGF